MRISSQQAFNLGVKGIQNNYAEMIRTQQQISTGNRILTPADDPVASVRLMQLEQQQNMLGQYKENLIAANNSLVQEESVLYSVNDIMQRIRVLAEEAGNGALSQTDRQSIAAELREREDELLGLMNTKNARGEYLFAGFQGKTQPFVREGDGSFSYNGDEGQRKLQIASSLDIAISDNGKKVFQNVTNASRLNAGFVGVIPEGSSLAVSSPLIQDEIAFAGAPGYPDSQFEIQFDDAPDQKNYTIKEVGTGTVLQTGTLDDDDKLHDSLVFAGVVVHIDGVPEGGERINISGMRSSETLENPDGWDVSTPVITNYSEFAPYLSANIEIRFDEGSDSFQVIIPGDTASPHAFARNPGPEPTLIEVNGFSLSIGSSPMPADGQTIEISMGASPEPEKQGVLDTIYQLRKALEDNTDSPEGNRATRDAVAAAITNIDHAMVTIDRTRGDIGARMNIIETTRTDNEDVTLVNQAVQAELREVDYPEALSKLAFQSIILEAAQQSYVKISHLNLFNKM